MDRLWTGYGYGQQIGYGGPKAAYGQSVYGIWAMGLVQGAGKRQKRSRTPPWRWWRAQGAPKKKEEEKKRRTYLPTFFLRFFKVFRSVFRKYFCGVFELLMQRNGQKCDNFFSQLFRKKRFLWCF
jgi:hypothetical protein